MNIKKQILNPGSLLGFLLVTVVATRADPIDPQRVSDARDLINQAHQDLIENESDEALVELTQAINMDALPPDEQAQALTDRGTLLENEGNIQDAKGDYQGALRVVPGFAPAKARLNALHAPAEENASASVRPGAPVETKRPTPSVGIFLQVGAYKSKTIAMAAWMDMQQKHTDILIGLTPDVKRINLGSRGVWYRLRVTGFTDATGAISLCDHLKAEGGLCFLTEP